MEGKYNLSELALMSGLTTRTLRNYLAQGLLKGEKENGVWQFTAKDVESFFAEPFVKEGVRIKRNGVVFDFLADRKKKMARSCVILDLPVSVGKGNAISAFFCEQMNHSADVVFCYDWDNNHGRVILSGDAERISEIMRAYDATTFSE